MQNERNRGNLSTAKGKQRSISESLRWKSRSSSATQNTRKIEVRLYGSRLCLSFPQGWWAQSWELKTDDGNKSWKSQWKQNSRSSMHLSSEKLDDLIPVFWKKTDTKNGKTGASGRKQSVQIKSRLISLSQQYSGFKTDSEENRN